MVIIWLALLSLIVLSPIVVGILIWLLLFKDKKNPFL